MEARGGGTSRGEAAGRAGHSGQDRDAERCADLVAGHEEPRRQARVLRRDAGHGGHGGRDEHCPDAQARDNASPLTWEGYVPPRPRLLLQQDKDVSTLIGHRGETQHLKQGVRAPVEAEHHTED